MCMYVHLSDQARMLKSSGIIRCEVVCASSMDPLEERRRSGGGLSGMSTETPVSTLRVFKLLNSSSSLCSFRKVANSHRKRPAAYCIEVGRGPWWAEAHTYCM